MIFIDSDCIIDFLRGDFKAVNVVKKYSDELICSEINVFEVYFGIYRRKDFTSNEIDIATKFFSRIMKVFSFDEKCGYISAQILSSLIKKGEEINQNDCFIASVMIKNGCNKIITRNKKHFVKIKGIKVVSY